MSCTEPSTTAKPANVYPVSPGVTWPRVRYDYGQRTCPTCKGTGINPVATYLVCPKCNGETRVPV